MMYIDAYINNIYIYGIVWLLPEMGDKRGTLDFNIKAIHFGMILGP
jgi:hypothetical protein